MPSKYHRGLMNTTDTVKMQEDRKKLQEAIKLAAVDREAKYPMVTITTVEIAMAACAYCDERLAHYRNQFGI